MITTKHHFLQSNQYLQRQQSAITHPLFKGLLSLRKQHHAYLVHHKRQQLVTGFCTKKFVYCLTQILVNYQLQKNYQLMDHVTKVLSVFIGNNWLQLADTSQIRLWLHGPWVDSFFEVDSWLVSELNNTQTSLCKSPLQVVGACGEQDTHGVVSWVIANPWIVGEWWLIAASGDIGSIVESGFLLWSWEDTILTWDGMFTWDGIDGDIVLDTWYLEWASLCVPVETGVIQHIYYPSPLLISEIYPFSKYSGSYIEVYARGSYSWVVLFTWAGAWEKSLRVHVDVDTWVYIVFAAGERWDYILTWLSLRDDGETIGLVDDSAHVMDRVVYYSGSSIKSHYFSSYSW
jgi:hypothetical protein